MAFENSLGDLRKNIEYLIGEERMNGRIEELSAEYISRVLGVEKEEVEKVLAELG